MEHIKASLEDFLSKAGLKVLLMEVALREALGEEANKAIFHTFKAGVLWVKVPNPSWAVEIMSKKTEIIQKMNIFLNEKLVCDLKTLVYSRESNDAEEERS